MAPQLVALLPLKAHSQRIPGKNFRTLCGKPLVRWMLDTLLDTPGIARVVINTDARKELQAVGVVESDRLLIRNRPDDLCGDAVSMNRIIEDDLGAVESDLFLMTHTTNPLISKQTVIEAVAEFTNAERADSLFSVNRVQSRFYREDGSPVNHDPDNLIRTQDLEPWFEENSCLYVFSRDSFAATGARIGRRPILFETPPLESIDIDVAYQWDLAEALLGLRRSDTRS